MDDFGKSSVQANETEYLPVKTLGRGAFGEAVLYRKLVDNSLVVWKEVDLTQFRDRERKDAQNEVEILSLLNHANIVSYYNHFLDGNTLLIEMEYANGGTLYEKIISQTSLFPEKEVLWYLYQLVSAVSHVHEYGILHRDIKAQNVFLRKGGLIKLGDFGIARILESQNHMANTLVGTPFSMSPEIIKGEPYNFKSDIWAVGCLLYELLSLKRVFDATNRLKLAYQIVQDEFEEISAAYSKSLRNLCNSTLKKEPTLRPSADEILKREVFKDLVREFDEKVWELNTSTRVARLHSSVNDVIPLVTSRSSEVFYWGGGKLTPHRLEGFTKGRGALHVSVGGAHYAVVTVEKEVYTWANMSVVSPGMVGQLGHGDLAAYKAPKKVEFFDQAPVCQVKCGEDFTVFVTDQGHVYACGSDYYGCLGINNAEGDDVNVPIPVDFFSSRPVQQISCGDAHVIALCESGDLYTWGCGELGRLGLGSEDDQPTPQKVPVRGRHSIHCIEAGPDCSMLVKTNGRVLACGSNEHNKLGLNSAARGLQHHKEVSYDIPCQLSFVTVKPLSKYFVTFVSTGQDHSAVLDVYGHCITFGNNKFGQLGVGDCKAHDGINPVLGSLVGQQVIKVACGDAFTVCATADNNVFSWGSTAQGRLGVLGQDSGNYSPWPRPIFGSLHIVSDLACRHWNTILVAEKVLHQKTIKSSSSTKGFDSPMNMPSPPVFEQSPDFSLPTVPNETESNDRVVGQTGNSAVPTWLQAELNEAEFIPAVHLLDSVESQEAVFVGDGEPTSTEEPSQDQLKEELVHVRTQMQQLLAEKQELQQLVAQQAETIKSQSEKITELEDKVSFQHQILGKFWSSVNKWQVECSLAKNNGSAGTVNQNIQMDNEGTGVTASPIITNKCAQEKEESAENITNKLCCLVEDKTSETSFNQSLQTEQDGVASRSVNELEPQQNIKEQMNIEYELPESVSVVKTFAQECISNSQQSTDKCHSMCSKKLNMLTKSYKPTFLQKSLVDVTTKEEMI